MCHPALVQPAVRLVGARPAREEGELLILALGDSDADTRVLLQVSSVGTTAEQGELASRQGPAGVSGAGGWQRPVPLAHQRGARDGHRRELDREDGTSVVGSTCTYVQRFVLTVSTPSS